jgi:nucleotide-binding universal stress UspA family protein
MRSFRPKVILAPTDFSDTAAHALRYAGALAARFNARLLVVYADTFTPPVDVTSMSASTLAISRQDLAARAQEELAQHVEANLGNDVIYDTNTIIDVPVLAITQAARESGADLIVMGTHGRTGLRRLVVGSVTEAVMRLADVPVIAVNPNTSEKATVRRVLCEVRYTPECRDAVTIAAALADSVNAPLTLLRTVDSDAMQNTIDDLIQLRAWVPRELVDRCELKIVPAAAPGEQVVEFAKLTHADLIAIGVPHDRSLADVLRGSTAERIVQQSGCPVLAVNSFAAAAERRAIVQEEKTAQIW